MDRYKNFVDDVQKEIVQTIPKSNPFFPLLTHEISQIHDILEGIEPMEPPRKKRSINILGTAWKYIAGSPDHDDFVTVKNALDQTILNNNQQVVINDIFTERLQNLTQITNHITKAIKDNKDFVNEAALSMQIKLRFIKEELTNIKFAIQWAKQNIINSFLLNKKEIKIALEKITDDNILFTSIEEALKFANIKVLYNQRKILYIIVIPLTSKEQFDNVIIKPVKRNNRIISTKFNEIMKNNHKIFGIKSECAIINNVKICKSDKLVNISNDTCIPPLLNGMNSSCPMAHGYHIPQIENISPGIILLNDFIGTINNDTVNGTFLIKFHNATLRINDKYYRNLEAPLLEVSPPTIQQTPVEDEFISLLSLEMLNHLHINNTKSIHELKSDSVVTKYTTFSLFTLFAICLVLIRLFTKKREKVIIHTIAPTHELIQAPVARTKLHEPRPQKIDDLPYF